MSTHERIAVYVRRRDALIEAEPMALEAVRLTHMIDALTEVRRSTGYEHGTKGYRYHGCRCPECCAAHADYQLDYRARPGVNDRVNAAQRVRRARARERALAPD